MLMTFRRINHPFFLLIFSFQQRHFLIWTFFSPIHSFTHWINYSSNHQSMIIIFLTLSHSVDNRSITIDWNLWPNHNHNHRRRKKNRNGISYIVYQDDKQQGFSANHIFNNPFSNIKNIFKIFKYFFPKKKSK